MRLAHPLNPPVPTDTTKLFSDSTAASPSRASAFVARSMMLAVRTYQVAVSPTLHALAGPGAGCRFSPTCSHYAIESLDKHGALRGTSLAARRLLRCHPWHPGGHDPVP